MTSTRHFHFSLGPVQGFVAQARRTRDFWAGSFILSWLSAVAMREVIAQHGKCLKSGKDSDCIRFPKPDSVFMEWLDGRRSGKNGPAQANIPNRFTAIVARSGFDPKKVEDAVRRAWRKLTDTVWKEDLGNVANPESRRIWDRQVEGFWEIAWALVDDPEDTAVLDRRKNWRSHLPPEEPGVKCMVMDGWQELSNAESPIQPYKAKLDDFWKRVREKKIDDTMRRDLRKREHLCALAFIKRRFPRHFEGLSAEMPTNWTAHGWQVPQTVPSVVYLAAVPWLAEVIEAASPDVLKIFHDQASDLTRVADEWTAHDERPTDIRRIKRVVSTKYGIDVENFRALEGGVFFETYLDDPTRYDDKEQRQARRVSEALRNLQRQTGKGAASPFYAVLLMDGDDIGKHMSAPRKQGTITEGLARFTERVPKLVYGHDGFLVYAGGDDVLALLPIDTVLPCACALSQAFGLAFEEAFDTCKTAPNDRPPATLSGAIEFGHMKMPLTRVLRDSHYLLDKVAKDGRGRDAIACRVWKPGHKALEWAIPWEKAVENGRVVVQDLAKEFARQDEKNPSFASRFFYRIRERLELLQSPKGGKNELSPKQAVQLMTAEYLSSGINQDRNPSENISVKQAEKTVTRLLDQCGQWKRVGDACGTYECISEHRWEADGALLVRFLANKGIEQ